MPRFPLGYFLYLVLLVVWALAGTGVAVVVAAVMVAVAWGVFMAANIIGLLRGR